MIARTAADPAALVAAMRRAILSLEPNAVFLDSQTIEAQVAASLLPARLAAQSLGASPADVLRMIMRQGLGLAAAGVGIGLVLSWVAARAIPSALYGIGAADLAARVDPSVALRWS